MTPNIAGKPFGDLGFGGGPLGVHGFGQVDLVECRQAVRYALDHDVTFFDTSDAYGKGVGEEQLALALDGAHTQALIATKGGIRFGADNAVVYDSSPEWMSQALDASLTRLKTDYIDLYQLHYWDQLTPLEDVLGTFARFQEAGKIGDFGISNLMLDPVKYPTSRGLASYSFDYSMVSRDADPQIKTMHTAYPDAVFVPTGVLAQGLLTGRYDKDSSFGKNDRRASPKYVNFQPNALECLSPFLDALRNHKASPTVLAIAWAMQAQPRSVPLVGIKSCKHVDDMLAARTLLATQTLSWDWVDAALA